MRKNSVTLLIALVFVLMAGCHKAGNDGGMILTVEGPITRDQIGRTLTHEHLLVDFIGADSTGYHRWNRDTVVLRLIPFLEELKQYDVRTFIDPTPAYLGRDPILLKMLSEKSGLQIVTNTGLYGARNNAFIPGEAFAMSAEEIAGTWIDEFESGIEGTGVRPGFIKIGVDRGDTLSVFHKKLVEAAALAHLSTGLVIASHTGPDAPAFEQMEILEAHDVPLSSFIWVHAQSGTQEGNIRAAEMGAWVSLDNVNAKRDANPGTKYSSEWYALRLRALREAGLLDHVLLSHDAGWYRPGEPNGGSIRGYTDLFTNLLPVLEKNGFTQEEIDLLLIDNPAKAFAIRE
jgi:phosphotriesterase-related protein